MPALAWALGASLLVSLISLIGVFTLLVKEKFLNRILILLIGFSAGGLIGGAFLHLLPEAVEISNAITTYIFLIVGFIVFFILERYLLWHHCHEGKCDVHPFGYLNLVGDGVHNFIDGLVIGASFAVDIRLGVVTAIVVILHEIPQEIGDFGVLVYGGFDKYKALLYNFLSGITAVLGSLLGFYFTGLLGKFSTMILPFTAGGFIYIACCDLIPEIHKHPSAKKATYSMVFFLFGIIFMLIMKVFWHH
ncbi:MAG: ZIP family metal transporter [Candidatus Omnitrophica bacterium]|nr:ZIP family metal transporter [Candidatus Omnitrophota bacterium]